MVTVSGWAVSAKGTHIAKWQIIVDGDEPVKGMLNIAVADPTQANGGTIQITPTVRLSVNVTTARGKTLRGSLDNCVK